MKNLLSEYSKLERQFGFLELFACVLFCLYVADGVRLVWEHGINLAEAFGRVGIIVSVLLVATVASRQLAHSDIVREDDRRRDIVRITHHLMLVLSDLRQRVSYASTVLSEGGRPLIALTKNVDVIEKRYEVFFDREEIYGYLSGKSVDLIRDMSGRISGLKTLSDGIAEACKNIDNAGLPSRKAPESTKLLLSLLEDLDLLDKQIRQLRETVS